jgi:plasmid maintenance system antidote protein VapI
MSRQESTDMATARDRRPEPGPGTEARVDIEQNMSSNKRMSNKQRRAIRRIIPAGPIANAIRKAIEEHDRGQWSIANAIGISEFTIADFMKNGKNLTFATADRLATFFEIGLSNDARSPTGSIITDLRSAVEADPRSTCAIAKVARVHKSSLCRFVRNDKGLDLPTAERIAAAVNLQVVIAENVPTKADPIPDPLGPVLDHLRSAVEADPRSTYAIARAADVSQGSLRRFVVRKRKLKLATILKVYEALGVEPHPAKLHFPSSEVSDLAEVPAAGPISASRDSATNEDNSIDQAASVELAEDGPKPWLSPYKVRGVEKTKLLTEKRYLVVQALLEEGREGLTGAALRSASGVPSAVTILKELKASDPDWDAVIHCPGPGGSGSWIGYA